MKYENVTKNIVKEIMEECNWWERIVVKCFSNIIIRVYKNGVKAGYNWNNKYVR